jgi:putative spermidine/putrescine transport system permease protein
MSVRVTIGPTIIALLLGVPTAYGLVRGNYPGKRFVTLFLLSPILAPIIVIALGLYLYYSSLGIAATDLVVILWHAMYTTPFVIFTCMTCLRHFDPKLEVAATIMGSGTLLTFWKVTLPLLKPATFAGGLFAFLMSFDEVVIA